MRPVPSWWHIEFELKCVCHPYFDRENWLLRMSIVLKWHHLPAQRSSVRLWSWWSGVFDPRIVQEIELNSFNSSTTSTLHLLAQCLQISWHLSTNYLPEMIKLLVIETVINARLCKYYLTNTDRKYSQTKQKFPTMIISWQSTPSSLIWHSQQSVYLCCMQLSNTKHYCINYCAASARTFPRLQFIYRGSQSLLRNICKLKQLISSSDFRSFQQKMFAITSTNCAFSHKDNCWDKKHQLLLEMIN